MEVYGEPFHLIMDIVYSSIFVMSESLNDKFFTSNRKKLAKQLDDNCLLILFAGKAPFKRGDEFYRFSPQRNFYYLTGIDKPGIVFTMYKNGNTVDETLYMERPNELMEKWVGAVLKSDEAREISGIKNFKWIDEFNESISSSLFAKSPVLYFDLENRSFDQPTTPDILFANKIKGRFPAIEIKNIYNTMAELRVIKSKAEIKCIQKAIDITQEGIYQMLTNSKAGMFEYEIEAHFDYILKKNGVNDRAFPTIAATGKNATILHYSDNGTKTNDGDLILFDLGAQCNYYSADITRTFPVNGKFSERQKILYNIVLEGQNKVIEKIKPGVNFKELNETIKLFYEKELKKIGLIDNKQELSKYYYHGVSHMLGLETHDVGRGNEGELKKGMVLTVEPGLYIEEEGIGIRIEDNVLVTSNGNDILSDKIVKSVQEIEKIMS